MSERFDPGPGYRWATRRENATAFILDIGTALLAAVTGASAGALMFGFFAWGLPRLLPTALSTTRAVGGTTTADTAPQADSGWTLVMSNGSHALMLLAGGAVGVYTAYVVGMRMIRALPVHSGPLRPVDQAPSPRPPGGDRPRSQRRLWLNQPTGQRIKREADRRFPRRRHGPESA